MIQIVGDSFSIFVCSIIRVIPVNKPILVKSHRMNH